LYRALTEHACQQEGLCPQLRSKEEEEEEEEAVRRRSRTRRLLVRAFIES
jgi:hemerythrin superfamily protein